MSVKEQIRQYISSLPEPKQTEIQTLHSFIQKLMSKAKLWFLDGKNDAGKIVSNPNIGYGAYVIKYADGEEKDFYQIGLSANATGISVYVMGLADKKYLADTYGKAIGKASVTGYCIKFKGLKDIDLEVLGSAIRDGFKQTNA